jgi:hypothetical protein
MSIFEQHNLGLKATPVGDTFYEQWVAGTYIVAGVFHRHCQNLDVRHIQEQTPELFHHLRQHKKGLWPRGISAFYAIPIYTSDGFDAAVVDWVHARPKYRYAMWHEPVLYDRKLNNAEMNSSWGLYGAAFRIFLFEAVYTALRVKSQHEGHAEFPLVNNEIIKIEEVR